MIYKAVMFDLDETLVETKKEYIYFLVNETLKRLGKTTTDESIDKFWFEGDRTKRILEEFGVDPDEFWKNYKEMECPELKKGHIFAYEDSSVVKEIKEAGFKIGLVTSCPEKIAEIEIPLIGRRYFDSIVIARTDKGCKPKPHPEGLIRCMNELRVSNQEVVYVGNAEEDLLAARAAGVLDIIIFRGNNTFTEIPSVGVDSLYELKHHLL